MENAEIVEEDYQYVFQEITESINGLKVEFDKVVEERRVDVGKNVRYKPKACHDVKNKRWLCAVLNFTRDYFT